MNFTWDQIQANAIVFSKKWKERDGKERQQSQMFINDFLACFGIEDPLVKGEYEHPCPKYFGGDGYIDYFSPGRIIIEMKTKGRSLDKAFEQVKEYMFHIPADEIPDLVMVSDFDNIILYHRTTGKRVCFKTKNLRKYVRKFAMIAGYKTTRTYENPIEVNIRAAEKMARLHDELKIYGYEGHSLEVYLVRILFCLFAEDTGIFPEDSFRNYIENSKEDGSDLSERISHLFEILNTPDEIRKKRSLLTSELLQFRYINGGLFSVSLPFADFSRRMRKTLIECCSFDWHKISPAIFGAMFQGVMNKEQRRELGAHYTSEENILKLINPLFMDDLWEEFERVKTDVKLLDLFHEKIGDLKFLDPACGCGNFLIITYRELRILELKILEMKMSNNQMVMDISPMLKVNVEQFYGIEYEDFPCQIAQVGMWLMDHQMNIRFAEQFGMYYIRLPLTQSATIVNGNALSIKWESIISKNELSFIFGNPPFVGYSLQSKKQKDDIQSTYVDKNGKTLKTAGKIDYVSGWYYKAADYMKETNIHTAYVSTNSIIQGEQVAAVWEPLYDMFHIHIDFGYRTFIWSNEAKGKAAVHCVIVGFSALEFNKEKFIIDEEGTRITVKNINAYLYDAPNTFVASRKSALCNAPQMVYGNKPTDGGNLFINADEYEDFIRQEPEAVKYIKKIYGATEYINSIDRYCLWLAGANPSELKKMPLVMDRIEKVKRFRLASKKKATQESATTPSLFQEIRQPNSEFIIVPCHSSEKRRYIPFGFVHNDIIVNNAVLIIPEAKIYHFGILISSVHMEWVRVVCGRIKSDYRYSKVIVYNNFPWPTPTDAQKMIIEEYAQDVLNKREVFSESSLADLYDPLTMPPELLKAHQNLDRAVMKAYGYSPEKSTEISRVADLMQRYKRMIEN